MPWCDHCGDDCPTERDLDNGFLCCIGCGKIIDQDIYTDAPTFEKTADGGSRLVGQTLNSVESAQSASYFRTLDKGKDEMLGIMTQLQMGGNPESLLFTQACQFYAFALGKQFTRGRITSQVAAVCLYLACRVRKLPYLLIDFSEPLQTNVYVLGAVFLQLCKLLSLDQHPEIRRPVDPSLFIDRFTINLLSMHSKKVSALLQETNKTRAFFQKEVSHTALRIIASMKRDWMQTGRKPSGLCGAALYISALANGHYVTKSDIVTVVHICEATLTKRLIEFENTESGSLTVTEIEDRANRLIEEQYPDQLPRRGEVLCQHRDTVEADFAYGLCKDCYDEFVTISGGLHGGAEPPAFQRAERQRRENAEKENIGQVGHEVETCEFPDSQQTESQRTENAKKVNNEEAGHKIAPDEDHGSAHANIHQVRATGAQDIEEPGISAGYTSDTGFDSLTSEGPNFSEDPESTEAFASGHTAGSPGTEEQVLNDTSEEENFSDIDDDEVDGYLHDDEEKRHKEIIWKAMNKEYLEEQAAKEAAAAAGDTEAVPKKERKRRRPSDPPAQTAAEATKNVLDRKGHSSKINYEALNALFEKDNESRIESDTVEDEEKMLDPGKEGSEGVYDDYYGEQEDYYGNNEDYGFEL